MVSLWRSAKQQSIEVRDNDTPPKNEEEEEQEENDDTQPHHNNFDQGEEEEDPYNICPEDIYDTVDANSTYNSTILNRPPAPIPRPEFELDRPVTYISRGIVLSGFHI